MSATLWEEVFSLVLLAAICAGPQRRLHGPGPAHRSADARAVPEDRLVAWDDVSPCPATLPMKSRPTKWPTRKPAANCFAALSARRRRPRKGNSTQRGSIAWVARVLALWPVVQPYQRQHHQLHRPVAPGQMGCRPYRFSRPLSGRALAAPWPSLRLPWGVQYTLLHYAGSTAH